MMHFEDTFHNSCEQQRAEGHDMHGYRGVGELLIIAAQAMASPRPGTTSLHHPASWQQHKAFPGLGQSRHLEVQGVRFGLLRRVLPLYAWSTEATSTASPVASWTCVASACTWWRSGSLAAVTGTASR